MNLSKCRHWNKARINRIARKQQLEIRLILLCCAWLVLCLFSATLPAALVVVDDSNRTIRLPRAAQRIVSLAPHVTELLYEIGAGEHIVGTESRHDALPYPRQRSSDNRAVDGLTPIMIVG